MKRPSTIFYYFLLIWGILNLVQSFLTPIHNDEAYYWMYSKYLAWGYYDHPPMIAVMIRAGYELFNNELGTRLFVVLSQIAVLGIIWVLADKEKRENQTAVIILILMVAVLPVMNIYGFIAAPDSPLLLFTALFLLFYRRFLNDENWLNTLGLGVIMAGLMYSKYHGAIMLLLIIISNLSLLRKPKFYLAAVLSVALFIPHLYWQFSNDFPSIRYHLSERAAGFDFNNVPEYLFNQLLIHNPLLLPLFLWVIFRSTARDAFERGLKYIVAGFFLFFFAASFRYSVQPQWTALIRIPMMVLFINHAEFKSRNTVYIRRVSIILIPLFLFARAALMIDFLPVSFLKDEFHSYRTRMAEFGKLAGDRPVVFTNSYQNPSVYTFYTGKFAHTLDNKDYRKTQYDLWPFEEQIRGKEVLYIPHWLNDYYKMNLSVHVMPGSDTVYCRIFEDFQSLQKECVLTGRSLSFSKSAEDSVELKIFNPYSYSIDLKHPVFPVVFHAAFYRRDGYLELRRKLDFPEGFTFPAPGDTIRITARFRIDELPEGEYRFAILSETGILYDTFSSRFSKAMVSR